MKKLMLTFLNLFISLSNSGFNIVPLVLNRKMTSLLSNRIKCISPFHHIANSDNKLYWCDDLNKRQWFTPDKIPYVYIVQQALQAISGVLFYNMKSSNIMWFIRWSPMGFSIFKFKFIDLVKLGVVVANLYFSFYQKLHSFEDIENLYPFLVASIRLINPSLDVQCNAVTSSSVVPYVSNVNCLSKSKYGSIAPLL